jgi:hypothetical protein
VRIHTEPNDGGVRPRHATRGMARPACGAIGMRLCGKWVGVLQSPGPPNRHGAPDSGRDSPSRRLYPNGPTRCVAAPRCLKMAAGRASAQRPPLVPRDARRRPPPRRPPGVPHAGDAHGLSDEQPVHAGAPDPACSMSGDGSRGWWCRSSRLAAVSNAFDNEGVAALPSSRAEESTARRATGSRPDRGGGCDDQLQTHLG